MINTIPLSLYVHIPWCVKKCPYCDFNSHEKNLSFEEDRYVEALIADLDDEFQLQQKNGQSRQLKTIFFGGGTPSLFSADSINKILSHAQKLFMYDEIETTLEANPGTFEQEKFDAYYAAGINRLSIGIQSFNDTHLSALGRIHDKQQALTAIDTARMAGFQDINLDLMFGLPQQNTRQAIDDVTTACQSGATHISHYQLTIEPNTYFHKHTPQLPVNDLIWEMQTQCQEILSANDYRQYEVSAYARDGRHCRHNVNYWEFGDYIGIGAGAHGKLSSINQDNLYTINRRWKYRQPEQYIKNALDKNALSGTTTLDHDDIVFEYLLNALRLKTGGSLKQFEDHTGCRIKHLQAVISDIDPDLIQLDEQRISTTDKGYLFLNKILEDLL